jgi:hypothetical protein
VIGRNEGESSAEELNVPEFRLYHFKRGHIHRAEELVAVDDLQAVRAAKGMVDELPAELWRGKRKIQAFNFDPQ